MRGVKGGDIWGYEKTKKFIEWCALELTQSDDIRTNYYYLIREYICGEINPIGIIGIRQVNKQNRPNNRNQKTQLTNQKTQYQKNQVSINYNLDVFISPEYQNYGSGTCAIKKCLELYWTIHPTRQITINIPSDLANMIKIATNIGATMEKSFKTGRSTFLKYVVSAKTMKYTENDHLYLPPNERRIIISRRANFRKK
jgi:RimJ/RimL family protein N-acetyltransferase